MKMIYLLVFASLFTIAASASDNPHLIIVNGVAEKTVDPDIVVLHINILGRAPTAKGAQALQIEHYDKVKAVVEKYKIKKEDFKTEDFSVNPETNYVQATGENKIVGYRVDHRIKIVYRKIDAVGQVIDALTVGSRGDKSGISVSQIVWDYEKRSVVENAAMADAVKAARSKAEDLAKAAGVTIKAVHRIENYSASSPVARDMMMEADAGFAKLSKRSSTELSASQIKVRVDVQMQFEI